MISTEKYAKKIIKNIYKVPEKDVKNHHYICRGVYLFIIKKWRNEMIWIRRDL